jgi:copper chaperone
MISFSVNDMTCGHCVSNVTKAIKAVDQGAEVRIDLATHRVEIDSTAASAADLSDAIKEAGYTPVP